MLSCRDTAVLFSRSKEEDLPFGRRLAMRMHLMMCRLCRRYARQVELIDHAVREVAAAPAKALGTLSSEARDRIRTALETDRP